MASPLTGSIGTRAAKEAPLLRITGFAQGAAKASRGGAWRRAWAKGRDGLYRGHLTRTEAFGRPWGRPLGWLWRAHRPGRRSSTKRSKICFFLIWHVPILLKWERLLALHFCQRWIHLCVFQCAYQWCELNEMRHTRARISTKDISGGRSPVGAAAFGVQPAAAAAPPQPRPPPARETAPACSAAGWRQRGHSGWRESPGERGPSGSDARDSS